MTSETNTRRWGVAQFTGTSEVSTNVSMCEKLIEQAATFGCELVAVPENALYMGIENGKPKAAESLDGPSVTRLQEAARRTGQFVLLGSMLEKSDDPQRPFNTSVLLDPSGNVAAFYRKIHLFDVDAPDRVYRESDYVRGGPPEPTIADVAGISVGLTVCFDLRFPWLYQALMSAGVQAIFVPAAFTVPTGRDHWEILLRARAIENQCFVLAPAQHGLHETGRVTYGRSVIIDPWGTVLAQIPDGGSVAVADLDFSRVAKIRADLPMRSREPGRQ